MTVIFQRIMEIQAEMQEAILLKRNVVGVAAGYKETQGVITDEPAMVVMVEAKKPLAELAPDDVVPREVSGVHTDVYEVGKLEAQVDPTDRFRPTIPGGVSSMAWWVCAVVIARRRQCTWYRPDPPRGERDETRPCRGSRSGAASFPDHRRWQ